MKNFTYLILLCISMLCSLNLSAKNDSKINDSKLQTVQRVRINFETPNGYVRHLLLGFTTDNAATDGVDYGYDGPNIDNFEDDLNWMIEGNRYVIQGVGEFDDTKQYPLGMFLTNSGEIKISVESLENFETQIDIFVYDSELDTYTFISEIEYSSFMPSGDYLDRFFLAFKNLNATNNEVEILSLNDHIISNPEIQYFSNSKELSINLGANSEIIDEIILYTINGRRLQTISNPTKESKLITSLQYIAENQIVVRVNTNQKSFHKLLIIY